MKKALITGITGQDGSYLAELLLEKGYDVHGLVRRTSNGINSANIESIKDKIKLHIGDLTDYSNLKEVITLVNPEEIYNLAAQSHVGTSFEIPTATSYVNAIGTLNLLENIRTTNKNCKFYQASTSELFGKVKEIPQTENTSFYPRSPYAVAKLYGYWITVNYRESYSIYACNGILFNHESPRRGPDFVTRKIVIGLVKNYLGLDGPVKLGNLNALRDWGHAKDYVRAMWAMLQKDTPDDYIIATGEQHSVRDFCEEVASFLNYNIEWVGTEENEKGINSKTGKIVIEVSKDFYRPAEVNTLLGNPSKAMNTLQWTREYTFKDLVSEMCEIELQRIRS